MAPEFIPSPVGRTAFFHQSPAIQPESVFARARPYSRLAAGSRRFDRPDIETIGWVAGIGTQFIPPTSRAVAAQATSLVGRSGSVSISETGRKRIIWTVPGRWRRAS